MIVTIIKREILEYLKSSKLLIGLSLTVILITISTIINIGDFQQRRQDYLDASKNAERSFRVEIFREPKVLSTLVRGKDRKLGSRLEFNYMNLPIRTSGYMGYASHPAPAVHVQPAKPLLEWNAYPLRPSVRVGAITPRQP